MQTLDPLFLQGQLGFGPQFGLLNELSVLKLVQFRVLGQREQHPKLVQLLSGQITDRFLLTLCIGCPVRVLPQPKHFFKIVKSRIGPLDLDLGLLSKDRRWMCYFLRRVFEVIFHAVHFSHKFFKFVVSELGCGHHLLGQRRLLKYRLALLLLGCLQ